MKAAHLCLEGQVSSDLVLRQIQQSESLVSWSSWKRIGLKSLYMITEVMMRLSRPSRNSKTYVRVHALPSRRLGASHIQVHPYEEVAYDVYRLEDF